MTPDKTIFRAGVFTTPDVGRENWDPLERRSRDFAIGVPGVLLRAGRRAVYGL